MNETETTLIQDLNELLQGTHMGASTFKEYLSQARNGELHTLLEESLALFHTHEKELTHRILDRGGNPEDDVPVMGMISSFFEKIKTMMAENDEQILDYALRALDMGMKSTKQFEEKHASENMEAAQLAEEMIKGYKEQYKKLTHLKLK